MLSESCRPALNLTNHTPMEKDSKQEPGLETEEKAEGKKKSEGGVSWAGSLLELV